MKKTLILMALLGSVAAPPLFAEIVTWDGVTYDKQELTVTGAVTSYKHRSWVGSPAEGDTADYNLCGPASSSNVLAWWLDRVEQSGALIVPSSVPRDYEVWEEVRTLFPNKAIQPGLVMQFWITGFFDYSKDQWLSEKGKNFEGYFPHLSGGYYTFRGDPRPDNCLTSFISADGINGTYQESSQKLVQGMKDGWGYVLDVGAHYMTVYGAETDENGNIKEIYYSDNNNSNGRQGYASYLSVSAAPGMYGDKTAAYTSYSSGIASYYGLRSKGLEFDTYELTMTGESGEEDLFSHYMNLTIDGHQNYELKYDLRDADAADSPVNSNLPDGTHVKTGNLTLRDGRVTLLDSTDEKTKEYDRGGSVEGTITFADKQGAERTLRVDRTGDIAAAIDIQAAAGNMLEVTENNTATFGRLTGAGNLDKTGKGTAEVTGEVTLKGSIAVQEGTFILGSDATLSQDTVLTVGKDGSMESKADAAVQLTISSGTHTNDGVLTTDTTVRGGTLKGSGTFGKLTVAEGGTLIVGNSPGVQTYNDMLTVSGGDVVFCADGLAAAADSVTTGWGSDTYSVIHMNDHVLNYENGQIFIDLSGAAAEALTLGNSYELTLVDGLSNELSADTLTTLAQNTSFRLSAEDGAAVTFNAATLTQPNFSYKTVGNALVLSLNEVPEPATLTLSLLALAGLCARRRRK